MKDKYILDSSIWIALERKHPFVSKMALPWIEKNEICCVDLINAEVLRGTKTKKDFHSLQKAFFDFPTLFTTWESTAELAFAVSKKGFQPPLADLYIAQCTIENKKILVTQDKHFCQIARVKHFSYILVPT